MKVPTLKSEIKGRFDLVLGFAPQLRPIAIVCEAKKDSVTAAKVHNQLSGEIGASLFRNGTLELDIPLLGILTDGFRWYLYQITKVSDTELEICRYHDKWGTDDDLSKVARFIYSFLLKILPAVSKRHFALTEKHGTVTSEFKEAEKIVTSFVEKAQSAKTWQEASEARKILDTLP